MSRAVTFLIVSIVAMTLLVSAGPALAELLYAAVPLVVAIGAVAVLLRLVWYFTNRY